MHVPSIWWVTLIIYFNYMTPIEMKLFCFSRFQLNQTTDRKKMNVTIVWISWMSWNFVRFHEIQFQTDAESFSFLSWKTKKFYSYLKKNFFKPLSISKQKSFVYWHNFQWRFCVCRARKDTYFRTESEDVSIVQKMQFDDRFLAKRQETELAHNWVK